MCILVLLRLSARIRHRRQHGCRATNRPRAPFQQTRPVERAVTMRRPSRFRDRCQLYWSRRGDVACHEHAPIGDLARWTSESWRSIDTRDRRLRLQCPTCHDGSPIQRQARRSRGESQDTASATVTRTKGTTNSRIVKNLVCSRCHKAGSVRVETRRRGGESTRYTCQGCGHGWTERTGLSDANRRLRASDRRRVSRTDRRTRR